MASANLSAISRPSPFPSFNNNSLKPNFIKTTTLPLSNDHRKPIPIHSLHITNNLSSSDSSSSSSRNQTRATGVTTNNTTSPIVTTSTKTIIPPQPFVSRFPADVPRKGADILVEALEREGVTDIFAYPGGASMEIHQALTRSVTIRNVLPRHEQGGIFAAEGYARASGLPGVCIATSGPGATNLVLR